jgi:NAD(P)-dependent dehydrogenase (short-subunit alcohol dehydrogenase family)
MHRGTDIPEPGDMDTPGKRTTILTGGGIGRAIAEKFMAHGIYTVIVGL